MNSKSGPEEPTAPRAASEAFFRNLSLNLHAAAQPLCILRGTLGNPYLVSTGETQLRELVQNAAAEVERVCTLFGYLQEFVITESTEPTLLATPARSLIGEAVEGVELLFQESEISLRSSVPEGCGPILISRKWALAALSSVLLIAHAVSHRGDTVDLVVTSERPNSVQAMLLNRDAHVKDLKTDANLRMALAEANLARQRALMSWILEPFTVFIEFPGASAEKDT
jgi:hypothetical protein